MLKEFKEFALRGNVMDMAIGVIIGAAFGKIIASLVSDVLMPPIGLLLGRINFTDLFIALNGGHYATLKDAQAAGAPTLNYGLFINSVFDFVVVAFAVFLAVRQINRLKKAPAPADPTTKECPFCATQIALKAVRCPSCTSELKTA